MTDNVVILDLVKADSCLTSLRLGSISEADARWKLVHECGVPEDVVDAAIAEARTDPYYNNYHDF